MAGVGEIRSDSGPAVMLDYQPSPAVLPPPPLLSAQEFEDAHPPMVLRDVPLSAESSAAELYAANTARKPVPEGYVRVGPTTTLLRIARNELRSERPQEQRSQKIDETLVKSKAFEICGLNPDRCNVALWEVRPVLRGNPHHLEEGWDIKVKASAADIRKHASESNVQPAPQQEAARPSATAAAENARQAGGTTGRSAETSTPPRAVPPGNKLGIPPVDVSQPQVAMPGADPKSTPPQPPSAAATQPQAPGKAAPLPADLERLLAATMASKEKPEEVPTEVEPPPVLTNVRTALAPKTQPSEAIPKEWAKGVKQDTWRPLSTPLPHNPDLASGIDPNNRALKADIVRKMFEAQGAVNTANTTRTDSPDGLESQRMNFAKAHAKFNSLYNKLPEDAVGDRAWAKLAAGDMAYQVGKLTIAREFYQSGAYGDAATVTDPAMHLLLMDRLYAVGDKVTAETELDRARVLADPAQRAALEAPYRRVIAELQPAK